MSRLGEGATRRADRVPTRRAGMLPAGRSKRALIESSLYGGLVGTTVASSALGAELAQDARRLGEGVGTELLAVVVPGAVLGLLPGTILGLLLGHTCLLLLRAATSLFGPGRARWLAFSFVVVASACSVSVRVGAEGAWAQFLLLLVWTTAALALLRTSALAREPDPTGVDEATAARLRRAFDKAPDDTSDG